MTQTKKIMLVAGGTGGHVFPALALGSVLQERGMACIYVGDKRTLHLYQRNQIQVSVLASAAFGSSLWTKARAAFFLLAGFIEALDLLREEKPDCVVGFGGYPSFVAVAAAQLLGIPTVLHEQNALLGRANRWLIKRTRALAVSFMEMKNISDTYRAKMIYTGNPVRSNFSTGSVSYNPITHQVHLVIIGGSQGSAFFNTLLPKAIALLPPDQRARLKITQQVRAEDMAAVTAHYAQIGIEAHIAPFFDDMLELYKSAHLVVARSGASTIAELTAVGRPAFFIPLASAMDDHQMYNALSMVTHDAAWVLAEKDVTPDSLAYHLAHVLAHPELLQAAAQESAKLGRPWAAAALADVVFGFCNNTKQ